MSSWLSVDPAAGVIKLGALQYCLESDKDEEWNVWFDFHFCQSVHIAQRQQIKLTGRGHCCFFLQFNIILLDIKSIQNFLPCFWGNWATLSVINSSYFEFKMLSNWIKVLCKWVGRSGVQGDSTASITAYLHTKLWQSLHSDNNYVSAWPRTANTQQTWV